MILKFYLSLLACELYILQTDCLSCYNCQNLVDPKTCDAISYCVGGEVCHLTTIHVDSGVRYTMGCAKNEECIRNETHINNIVGRSMFARQQQDCHECCSTDECNDKLCPSHASSGCSDDDSFNCAKAETLFGICNDIDHAKTICPKFCGLCNVVDGQWSSWGNWSSCSITCGNGTLTRVRSCTNPAPASGGKDCVGSTREQVACTKELCPVHGGWSEWSQWDTCSVACGIGVQKQIRTCSNPYPQRFGNHCFGATHKERICMNTPCTNGGWSDWGSWGSCSVKCGGGLKYRHRSCNNPSPSPFGRFCTGTDEQSSLCNILICRTPAINHCDPDPCRHGTCIDDGNGAACTCEDGYEGHLCENKTLPIDCQDIVEHPARYNNVGSGVYTIRTWRSKTTLDVYCDMTTEHGGWTVFQHRVNGSLDFNRNFSSYDYGFGSPTGEHWLGLKYVQEMTAKRRSQLRLDAVNGYGLHRYALYQLFWLEDRPEYTLHIGTYSGTTTGDGLSTNNKHVFVTKDQDNYSNCANSEKGGWWYNGCSDNINLNGEYMTPGTNSNRVQYGHGSFVFYNVNNDWKQLRTSKMMFRR